ncbi:hypothetical protein J1N35_017392 [Gossypium stocksii]|uniref:Endonuclease/exonuclease/phosphatase domain-containing protein n=1 Tax=Gossypium stocksii TaxID=47602 RepID=A0A9D3VNJ3_9ROSI|nr:hypothetical protein J1N35_017392 [Gossypium stocksii]
MKILCWNVCGLGSPQAVRRLQPMLKVYHSHIIFFMETKLNATRMEVVRRRCGFFNGIDVTSDGSQGGLSIGWNDCDLVHLKNYSKNHIDVEIQETKDATRWQFTGFYRALEVRNKQETWDLLRQLENVNLRRKLNRFRFESWWTLENSCEEETKKLWEKSSSSYLSRMDYLANGLKLWASNVRHKREGEVKRLHRRLEELNCRERLNENFGEILEVKLHLNLKIDKEERY